MSSASAQAFASPVVRPPIRLRTVLLFMAVAGAIWWAYPRMQAAWQLHSSATALANYGLCMVGPTGPSLLRDNPEEFRRLVRRRLVAALADERPFYDCADAALELTGAISSQRAHLAPACDFVEYGATAADRAGAGSRGELSVQRLDVTTRRLAELTAAAWPFVRGGYTRLVKASASAHQAVHVVQPPRPAVGSGLPAWRARYRSVARTPAGQVLAVGSAANLSVYLSDDGGVRWTPASAQASAVAEVRGRCPAGPERAFRFGLSDDDATLTVESHEPGEAPHVARLAPASLTVFAAACDKRALVVALRPEAGPEVTARICRFRAACVELRLPPLAPGLATPHYPLDLARVDGAIVLAVAAHGLVRVASSRDDGRSWTPYTVAFDRGEYPELAYRMRAPDHLLAMGSRLLLYGGAHREGQSYLVLASDNAGASWRTP